MEGESCWMCTGVAAPGESHVYCLNCRHSFHESCLGYYRQFDCPQCAEEPWIGAVEF